MTRTRPANEDALPSALRQLKQMIDGSQSEIDLGRSHSSGTLSVSGAIRAVDLICDAELGEHSTAANHRDAIELLATIPGKEHLVEDFSTCHSRKTEFNYHASNLSIWPWTRDQLLARAGLNETLFRVEATLAGL